MIRAKDLRIGNWVSNGSPIQIEWFMLDEGLEGYLNYLPILITPEILEKCGFYWSVYHQAWHFGSAYINEFYDLNECFPKGYQLSTFKKGILIGTHILYLHQLQNLYYTLTGEELEVNL